MKKIGIIILALVLLVSCKNQDKEIMIPEDIMPVKDLTSILVDLHVAQAAVSMQNLAQDSADKLYVSFENDVFKKHNITEKHFNKSYAFYMENVSLMTEIYPRVVDSLSMKESMQAEDAATDSSGTD